MRSADGPFLVARSVVFGVHREAHVLYAKTTAVEIICPDSLRWPNTVTDKDWDEADFFR
jgi:hypothetical protein